MGRKAGLRLRPVSTTDFTKLPVPCVVHLVSEHYVLVRERRGDIYQVYDPATYGPDAWTADDISAGSHRMSAW